MALCVNTSSCLPSPWCVAVDFAQLQCLADLQALETGEVALRLAKNAAKYLEQLRQRRSLNALISSYDNHDEAARKQVQYAMQVWAANACVLQPECHCCSWIPHAGPMFSTAWTQIS